MNGSSLDSCCKASVPDEGQGSPTGSQSEITKKKIFMFLAHFLEAQNRLIVRSVKEHSGICLPFRLGT